MEGRFVYKESDDDLLSHARCTLSLARSRFTVLFEMGRSGANLLWSSDITVVGIRCGSVLSELPPLADAFWRSKDGFLIAFASSELTCMLLNIIGSSLTGN